MTPHEKAVNAVNARLERLQSALRDAKADTAQRLLLQALVVTLGVAEALTDYIREVGKFAERRHAELKQASQALGAEHTELLKSGQELLEKLKANPTDRALRKEIERAQTSMAAVQKSVRRGANALQRDVTPGLAAIDRMSESVRRLAEAEQGDALKRVLKATVGHVRDLYAAQPALPARNLVDAAAWEKAAAAEIEQAAGFVDAYARTGYQAALALAWMTLAVSENPPTTADDASRRANEAVAARIKEIAARFTAP